MGFGRVQRGAATASIALCLLCATACSATSPSSDTKTNGSDSPTTSTPLPSLTSGADCATAIGSDQSAPSRDSLQLGPLWIAGALGWEHSSLAEWIGEDPVPQDGWYFVKAGVTLLPNRSVRLSVKPRSQVRLTLAGSRSLRSQVTYASCPDHTSSWVGGLMIRKPTACAVITFRTDEGETGRETLPIFRACPS